MEKLFTLRDMLKSAPTIESITEDINELVSYKDEVIERQKREIADLKDEHYKDGRIKEMEDYCETLRRNACLGFPVTQEEHKAINEWTNEHEKKHPGGHGCSGGKYKYEFVPTSIGVVGSIVCSCGEKFTFQDL